MTAQLTKSRATGRVTLADVAKASQVSPMTASRALRGERAVDPVLVARVRDAADLLGYVPDPAARALASRHSSHVAMLLPMLSNTLFVDVLEAVQNTLQAAGFQTLMGVTHYDCDEEEQLLREQLLHRPAGLIVTGYARNEATRQLIAKSGVPCVHLMELLDSNGNDGIYSVGFSHEQGSAAMTQHLIQQGNRRIAFAAAQLDPRTMQRLEGWRQTLKTANMYDPKLECLDASPSSIAQGGKMFAQISEQQPDVDAIFYCNDDLAQGALLTALRLGIRVPEQIAIAGFNDLNGSDQMLPTLTTVRTPRTQIGTASAEMLLALIKGQPVATPCVDLGFELIVRNST
jgi:LacI family transcriptional regulator, gluconate utilization system Gnt-I transcriptional repressor